MRYNARWGYEIKHCLHFDGTHASSPLIMVHVYKCAELFEVSASTMRIRLEKLGVVEIEPEGKFRRLHRHPETLFE